MLITDKNDGWDSKINFIDSNDVFVGFDYSGQCCEVFGWYLSNEVTTECDDDGLNGFNVDGYAFDTSFFDEKLDCGSHGEENFVAFKLVKSEEQDLYLHLYNHHNGYYSHGFEARVKGEVWKSGCF